MKDTPGLDRLTEAALVGFLANAADLDFRLRTAGLDVPTLGSAELAFLRSDDTMRVEAVIRELHRAIAGEAGGQPFDLKDRLETTAVLLLAELDIEMYMAVQLVHFIDYIESQPVGQYLVELLREYPHEQIAIVFMELYRMEDAELRVENPDNVLDFNMHDAMPEVERRDTPHEYLNEMMIINVVIARLIKKHGCELVLAWLDGADLPA